MEPLSVVSERTESRRGPRAGPESRPGVGETLGRDDGLGWDVTDTCPGRGLAAAVVTFGAGDGRATAVRFGVAAVLESVVFGSFCGLVIVACGPRCCLS